MLPCYFAKAIFALRSRLELSQDTGASGVLSDRSDALDASTDAAESVCSSAVLQGEVALSTKTLKGGIVEGYWDLEVPKQKALGIARST